MSLKGAILSRMYAPKVRHRLPGRLRLHVPLLKRVPEGREFLATKLEELFLLPAGVKEVKVSFVSGSILVEYDVSVMGEESVLQWVGTLWRLIGEHYDRLEQLTPDRVDLVLSRITPLLQAAINENHSLEKRIDVPDDVWS